MNKTLFQITDEMYKLIEYGCDAEGEIPQTQEEFNLMYDAIQLELTTKIDNTNSVVKVIGGEIELIDTEIKRLQGLKKLRERNAEWMKNRVDFVLKSQFTDEDGVLDVDGLKEAVKNLNKQLQHSAISYRNSESVEIIDADKIPKKYTNTVVEVKPDKAKLKEYLNTLPKRACKYAKIKTNTSMSIK